MNRSNFIRRAVLASALTMSALPLAATGAFAATAHTVAAPSSPVITSVSSTNRALTVLWTEVTLGVVTYKATATSTGHATKSCTTKSLKCSITSLVNGATYSVVVVASNAGGKSAASASVSLTVGAPSAPLSVHAKVGKLMAAISWAPPSSSGISAIKSYTATATGGAFCTTSATATVPAARHCVISGLTKGQKYSVTVTATNAFGTSPASKSVSFTSN
jgi:hypothetical protein